MAKSAQERFSSVLFYGVILTLTYLLFRVFEPFLIPLGWAAVFAVIFDALNVRLQRRFGPSRAAAIGTASVTIMLVVPVLLIAILAARQGIDATAEAQAFLASGNYGWLTRAWIWVAGHIPAGMGVDLPGLVRQGASRAGEFMASQLGTILKNIITFLFELFVMLFALFYFFRDGGAIVAQFRLMLPFEDSMREKMLSEARDLVFASVTTSLVIAVVQGVICGGAFRLVGLRASLFWGVVMAFLSLLPVVGAWPVWIPATVWLFSSGHYGRGLVLIGICGVLGGTIDSILRPVLVGGRASLNGLLVFISVLGGIAVFGVLGVIMGPIVVATAVGVIDVYSGKPAHGEAANAANSTISGGVSL